MGRGNHGYDVFDMCDMFGGGGGYYGDDFHGLNKGSFAQVSNRAMSALSSAKSHFLEHLKTVDTSRGSVSHEIIRFHLVADTRKQFAQFVKEYDCTATFRQLTREEQDRFYKKRKSLIHFTSVTVTPEAQQAYFLKNPAIPRPATLATATIPAASPAPCRSKVGPLQDAFNKKAKQKRNEAAAKYAASNSSVKKINTFFKKKT
ncbi:hypothetical protein JR316_0012130 [Psilocybe cubensis]|uniref:Uncharacterized protein n=2 Tax=Psilocybe cubensis TaxID=181762 RepID=A0A8H7XMZ8_PSICU|nr:hypothetical protein JR316_0012130 [Psilocybe cubensis]KAH9475029.1 hypothetical protein JR316_0012130 [Psilocybe cubensis]